MDPKSKCKPIQLGSPQHVLAGAILSGRKDKKCSLRAESEIAKDNVIFK